MSAQLSLHRSHCCGTHNYGDMVDNRKKARAKVAKLHARISNTHQNALHQLTTDLTRRFHPIGIEDLNVRGMMANRNLARVMADMGLFEFRRQLEYKGVMRGGTIIVVDRWYPSSKTCSTCGLKREQLPLSVRLWVCDGCGLSRDRDHNAAINLENYAVSSTVSACGGEGAGLGGNAQVKPAPVKQKVSFEPV